MYDGPDEKSMLIGELFGTPSNQVVKSISSSGKSMLIDFKKQVDYGAIEVVAFIKYNKITPPCQSCQDKNTLISPNNTNINCSWIITRKFGYYITLHFNFIEVKPIDIAVIINSN